MLLKARMFPGGEVFGLEIEHHVQGITRNLFLLSGGYCWRM